MLPGGSCWKDGIISALGAVGVIRTFGAGGRVFSEVGFFVTLLHWWR
jgi:hypothetical protein